MRCDKRSSIGLATPAKVSESGRDAWLSGDVSMQFEEDWEGGRMTYDYRPLMRAFDAYLDAKRRQRAVDV